jgi:hypothetical protein
MKYETHCTKYIKKEAEMYMLVSGEELPLGRDQWDRGGGVVVKMHL